MLIVAGQTSIMDEHDVVLAGLQDIGATVILHGAPVDPGNLLALAAMGEKPILCAPGCARSMATNVVDLILPRMLAGEALDREEMARLALGGLLH
jgi:molybdenum cofactor cytidylyltransferase